MDLALLRGKGAAQGPIVLGIYGFRVAGVAELDIVRQLRRIRVVRPGLQQKYGRLCVRGQSAGQDRPGSSPTDDDDVIFHRTLLPKVCGILWSAATMVPPFAV